MGTSFIYAMLFLSALFLLGIVLLIRSLKRKSVFSFLISITLVSPMVLTLSANYIDEISISKKDVTSDLKHLRIDLNDDFEITDNTVRGIPERIQETKLEISTNDKRRIINIIKNATNFKSFKNQKELGIGTPNIEGKIFNVEYPDFCSIEVYKPIDNYPTRMILTIHYENNILKYQRIED